MSAPPERMRCGHRDGLQAGGAEAVDGNPGNGFGKARAQSGDARHIHARFGFRICAAQDDVVDFGFVHLRVTFQQFVEYGGGHIVGACVL